VYKIIRYQNKNEVNELNEPEMYEIMEFEEKGHTPYDIRE
jgi:hypothetical protein